MTQYIVDAFTDKIFYGNPAAVCILENWIADELMINIAKENNLSETAFAVKEADVYHLRWFTPGGEIDLCGHATLACAFVIMNFYEKNLSSITFKTLSGNLIVEKSNDLYEMDFPSYKIKKVDITYEMQQALGARPIEAYMDRDLLFVMESEDVVANLKPDMEKLKQLEGLAQCVTAKSDKYDCASRIFAPKLNVNEDPVTGSAHCMIVPYWANKLNTNKITAFQASERTGILYCEINGERVRIAGKAALYAVSDILP